MATYLYSVSTAQTLIQGMLCKDTTRRLTALRVLNDAWFTVSIHMFKHVKSAITELLLALCLYLLPRSEFIYPSIPHA